MGQDVYPVCTLPGSSTLEMTCTLGNFDASLFELAVATDFSEKTDYQAMRCEIKDCPTATPFTVTLAAAPVEGSVKINGLTEVSTAPTKAGEFSVDTTTKVVTFYEDEGKNIEIHYETVESVEEIITDNKASAVGTLWAIFPVYDDGSDCTESGISGHVIIKVFRCRVTGKPTLGGQYKSASTYDITFSAIKNNSSDNTGKTYSIAYKAGATY